MSRYSVLVRHTMCRRITVHALDESQAEEKACDIVRDWKDVDEAEAVPDQTEET